MTTSPQNLSIEGNRDEMWAIFSAILAGLKYGVRIRLPHAFVMTFLFRNNLTLNEKLRLIARLTINHSQSLAKFAGLYKVILAVLKLSSRWIINIDAATSGNCGALRRATISTLRLIVNGTVRKCHSSRPTEPPGLPERPHHPILAGAIGGYTVWGRYSSVHHQIVLYLASRVASGCAKLAFERWLKFISPPAAIYGGTMGCKTGGMSRKKQPLRHEEWWGKEYVDRHVYQLFSSLVWAAVMVMFERRPDVLHPSLKASMDEIYRAGIKAGKRPRLGRIYDPGEEGKEDEATGVMPAAMREGHGSSLEGLSRGSSVLVEV